MGIKKVGKNHRVDWYDEHGKRRRKFFKDKDNAVSFLKEEIARVERVKKNGDIKRVRFSDFSKKWLSNVEADCRDRNKMNTYDWYKMIVDRHIDPLYGDKNLCDLKDTDIRLFKEELRAKTKGDKKNAKKLTPKSIRSYMTTFGSILKQAYKNNLTRNDLSIYLEKPKQTEQFDNKARLTAEEIGKFLAACPDRYKLFYAIAFFTGMRTGEILALTFRNIDIRHAKIHVNQSFSGIKKRLTTTKTGDSRIVDITPHLAPYFEGWRTELRLSDKLLFPTFALNNLLNRVWKPTLKVIELAERKQYVTRHTFASLMLSEGQSPTWVANMMGDSIETVWRNYYQYLPTDYKAELRDPIKTPDVMVSFLDTLDEEKKKKVVNIR